MKHLKGLVLLFSFLLFGCANTLNEARAYKPESFYLNKRPACVQQQLYKAALAQYAYPHIEWNLLEDGINKKWEITGYADRWGGFYEILFTVYADGQRTVLEKRVAPIEINYYGPLAEQIIQKADFANCPTF